MAVIHGSPEKDEGRFDDLLFRSASENKTYVVSRMRKGVRDAALEYRVLDKKEDLSLVSVHLLTGRTHQIRVQFSSRSMPLVGDRKYGAPEDNCETALWSSRLCFSHPRSGEKMDFSLNPTGGYPWSLFGFDGESVPSVRTLPSSVSAAPPCPQREACGGCQYQGIPYSEQLLQKQEYLRQLLGGFCSIEPIIGMEQPLHYRCKVHAAFGTDRKGKIVSGIYQPMTHKIVPVDSCLIEDETADSIIRDIRLLMPAFKITPFDEKRNTGFLRHVLIRKGFFTKQVMVVLVAASPVFRSQKAFLRALLEKHPEITTVLLNINSRYTPVVLGREQKILYGPGYIEDTLCGLRFRISAKSFYQVNPVQAEILYRTAVSLADLTGKEVLLDAYCGTGTIGLAAASSCAQVLGVEISRDAVQDAVANAKANGIRNAWFTCADAVDYIGRLAEDGKHCDVVLMDPPRDGSSEAFLSSLLRMKPDRIVYVSCGPESLARDLKILTAGGYKVQKIQPVDMFPYTEHVETVCCLYHQKKDFFSVL
jgi:23S rRNA (uracil1939-C5)-methyltransferase